MSDVHRRVFIPLIWFAAIFAPAAGNAQIPDALEPIRHIYLEAVTHAPAIDRGLEVITALEPEAGSDQGAALISAYRGALITLRAKHGSWPPTRLRHMLEGLAHLDAAVTAFPDHPEIRYLRLMSCFYLPGILGRNWSVREDFGALPALLPQVRDDYPSDLFVAITSFVLENGAITASDRQRLEAALAASADE